MSSERESANLAFYAIVYSKGLVEKQQLQGALNKATLDGLPLETVLLEAGAIKPAACVEVLSERAELGRTCRECEGVTYVLPDEDPSTKKCESCGGRLKRSRREEREARRTERQKRGGVSGTHKRRPVATGSPATGSSSRDVKALTDRLNELEAKLAEQVHQAVDTRLAQEDLQGYLDRTIPEQIERTLAEADLSGIVDRVSDEALQTVSARVEEADLSGLYDRVAEEAMEKVSGRLPAGGGASAPEVDTKAIADDATEQALSTVRAELEALEEQAVAKATERAMAMLQELKESSEEQASLAENGRLAVEEMLNQYDLPTLSDRITEQVLQALDARKEDDDEEEGEAASQSGAPSPEVLERIDAIDASMQELLDEMVELSVPSMKQELEALTQLDLASLRQQSADDLAALTARVDGFTSLQEMADELRRKVDELIANPPKLDFDPSSLRAELREEAVEVATRKAISAAKEEMQAVSAASQGASLEGLSGATDQVTAQAMQRLEESLEAQSKELADQAMAIIQKSLGAMDMSALTNKVMNEAYAGVEERLGELSLPAGGGGGGGGDIDMEALKVAVTEAVLPGLEANLAERLDRDLADLPDRIGQQAAGPVLQAIESRIEKLDLRNLPSKIAAEAMPAITEQVTERVLAQVGSGGGENGGASSAELEKTKAGILEWVESRFAQVPPPEAIVQMATSKATDAMEARLGEIEVKLAELEAAALTGGGGGGGASPEEVAQVVQAQVMAEVEERLAGFQPSNGGGGASPEEVAQVVQAQVMAEVEERLAGFQPSGGGGAEPEEVAQFVLAKVEERLASLPTGGGEGGGGGAEPEEVAQFVLAKVEERLASLPAGGGEGGDSAAMAELAAQNALAAVEARLSELGSGGGGGGGEGISEERVEEIARKAALEVGQAQSASGELAEMAVPSGSSVIKLPGFEKKFISLAKEVKNLRQTLSRMQAVANESVASSSPTGSGGGGDLVAALNSPEFKQMFDNKINQVMGYMKSDVIPKTVKKVLADQ